MEEFHANENNLTNKDCPIGVYQMGKVGSMTIIKSLEEFGMLNPLYHIHVLSLKRMDFLINQCNSKNLPLTLQLQQSKLLRSYLVHRFIKKFILNYSCEVELFPSMNDRFFVDFFDSFKNSFFKFFDGLNSNFFQECPRHLAK